MKALDIDGVLCAFTEEIFIPAMNDVLGTDITMKDADQSVWGYAEQFGISNSDEQKVWSSDNILKYMETASAISKGVNLIGTYLDKGDEHCFITARGSHRVNDRTTKIKNITKEWVKKTTGSDAPVYFVSPQEKHLFAKKIGVHMMYEDKPETVELLAAENIFVYMPLYEYNKNVINSPYIMPIKDWLE